MRPPETDKLIGLDHGVVVLRVAASGPLHQPPAIANVSKEASRTTSKISAVNTHVGTK